VLKDLLTKEKFTVGNEVQTKTPVWHCRDAYCL